MLFYSDIGVVNVEKKKKKKKTEPVIEEHTFSLSSQTIYLLTCSTQINWTI